jgi:hypothetical protein
VWACKDFQLVTDKLKQKACDLSEARIWYSNAGASAPFADYTVLIGRDDPITEHIAKSVVNLPVPLQMVVLARDVLLDEKNTRRWRLFRQFIAVTR